MHSLADVRGTPYSSEPLGAAPQGTGGLPESVREAATVPGPAGSGARDAWFGTSAIHSALPPPGGSAHPARAPVSAPPGHGIGRGGRGGAGVLYGEQQQQPPPHTPSSFGSDVSVTLQPQPPSYPPPAVLAPRPAEMSSEGPEQRVRGAERGGRGRKGGPGTAPGRWRVPVGSGRRRLLSQRTGHSLHPALPQVIRVQPPPPPPTRWHTGQIRERDTAQEAAPAADTTQVARGPGSGAQRALEGSERARCCMSIRLPSSFLQRVA